MRFLILLTVSIAIGSGLTAPFVSVHASTAWTPPTKCAASTAFFVSYWGDVTNLSYSQASGYPKDGQDEENCPPEIECKSKTTWSATFNAGTLDKVKLTLAGQPAGEIDIGPSDTSLTRTKTFEKECGSILDSKKFDLEFIDNNGHQSAYAYERLYCAICPKQP